MNTAEFISNLHNLFLYLVSYTYVSEVVCVLEVAKVTLHECYISPRMLRISSLLYFVILHRNNEILHRFLVMYCTVLAVLVGFTDYAT
jgi:hypothetical protein